jgi:hypothetical protein
MNLGLVERKPPSPARRQKMSSTRSATATEASAEQKSSARPDNNRDIRFSILAHRRNRGMVSRSDL